MGNEVGGVAATPIEFADGRGGTVTIAFGPLTVKGINEVLAWQRARLTKIARDSCIGETDAEAVRMTIGAGIAAANGLSLNAAGLQTIWQPDGQMRMYWTAARLAAKESQTDERSARYLRDFDEFMGLILIQPDSVEIGIAMGGAVIGPCSFLSWDERAVREELKRRGYDRDGVPDDDASVPAEPPAGGRTDAGGGGDPLL